MSELKTLKDLQKDKGNCDSLEIRQEAIKWIKKEDLYIDNWRTAFKHFFNITEKEITDA